MTVAFQSLQLSKNSFRVCFALTSELVNIPLTVAAKLSTTFQYVYFDRSCFDVG